MKIARWGIPLLLIVLAGSAWLIGRSRTASLPARPANSPRVLEVASVDLVPVVEGPLAQTVTVSGLLQPLSQTVLTAEIEGRIDQILVRTGDKVVPGQVLAHMDTQDLASRVAESRANLAAARAQLDLAERTQQRNEELKDKNFISANSLDNSRSTLESARESYRAREAQLALSRQSLPKATIRSPLKGLVSERAIELGQHVGVNARLFSVVDLSELEFAAKLPVREIGDIRVGQRVELMAEGVSGQAEGRVERISPLADDASRMITLFIRVANRDEVLKGGMVAKGRVVLAGRDKALSLPEQALREEQGKYQVLVLVGKQFVRRTVETGIRDETRGLVEVRAGLAAGDRVLLGRVVVPDLTSQVLVR